MAIRIERDHHIAEIILDHPPVNALDAAAWFGLARALAKLGEDSSVHAVILRGEGRGFCAGVDIKELAADRTRIVAVNRACYQSFAAVHYCSVPVIAAAHGFVLGGGIGLVGASDIVLAAEGTRFGLPEIDRGAMGGASHLLRMVSLQKARYMFFTGEAMTAEEMHRLGCVEAVMAADDLLAEARLLARKIADKDNRAIRLAKQALNGVEGGELEKNYRFEQGFTLELYASADSAEARAAFLEKRKPQFKQE